MRFIFFILIIFSVLAKDLVLAIGLFDDTTISMTDGPFENNSEKENQEPSEEKSKIDFLTEDLLAYSHSIFHNLRLGFVSRLKKMPALEISSPPPR